jgi:hypothetical protein
LAFVGYAFFPLSQLSLPAQAAHAGSATMSPWVRGLAGAVMAFVMFGPLGLAGYWLARKLELPGVYRSGATWRDRLVVPASLGLVRGMVLVVIDHTFVAAGSTFTLPHPAFPFSVIASACAALGEEIIFRCFALALVAFLLGLILRGDSRRTLVLWVANTIAALLFSTGHLPGAMVFLNVTSLGAIPAAAWAEIFLVCTLVGLVAGERYARDGLVAAIGVHFWTDVVWHVIWPLTGL